MNLERYGGRRFLLVVGTSVSTTLLTWFTKIDAATYSLVTLGICGAYITGNTVQKIKAPGYEMTNNEVAVGTK